MGISKRSKKFIVLFFSTNCLLFGALLFYVFILDPWQLFHQPWLREPVFIHNARFQNAGLINSYEFDSVIIGNSMAENFSASEASAQLGGTFINLSMAGSFFSERAIVLKHLFRKKTVKKVVISLDHLPYVRVGQLNKYMDPATFEFLYNRNPFDDFRIYFDVKLLQCRNLNTSCQNEIPGIRKASLENLYPWFPYYVKAFGGTDAWCDWSRQSAPFRQLLESVIDVSTRIEQGHAHLWQDDFLEKCKVNGWSTFDTYILPFIKEHPETEFYLFVPPYTRLWYAMQEQFYTSYYQAFLSFVEHIATVTGDYPNVRVFGFDDMDFTADLANYKDQSHYHKDINSNILQMMVREEHILSRENIEEYLKDITEAAHNYDLKIIADEFSKCLSQ